MKQYTYNFIIDYPHWLFYSHKINLETVPVSSTLSFEADQVSSVYFVSLPGFETENKR